MQTKDNFFSGFFFSPPSIFEIQKLFNKGSNEERDLPILTVFCLVNLTTYLRVEYNVICERG